MAVTPKPLVALAAGLFWLTLAALPASVAQPAVGLASDSGALSGWNTGRLSEWGYPQRGGPSGTALCGGSARAVH